MMNFIKSTGESSSKGQEDGDAPTGSERPLKKARFAWQVKGKYHLKNETDESNKNLTRQPAETSTTKPSSTTQSSTSLLDNKVENYLIHQEYSKLNSESDNSLLTPNNNISTEQLQYPRYMTTFERTSNNMLRSTSHNSVKTVSMTAEDECIAQWQAKQIVNGCLDNTLNCVLETWTTDILPEEAPVNSQFLTRDFAEFINHLPGDNSVENEGILMAISAHGLQNTPSSSSNNNSNDDKCSTSSDCAYDHPSPLRSLSPTVSENDSQHSQSHITKVQQSETEKEENSPFTQSVSSKLKNKMSSKIDNWQSYNQNANDSTSFAYISEQPQSPYHFYHDNHQNSNPDSLEIDSHFDFMNAAVLFAIKSKGLTASGTDYG